MRIGQRVKVTSPEFNTFGLVGTVKGVKHHFHMRGNRAFFPSVVYVRFDDWDKDCIWPFYISECERMKA